MVESDHSAQDHQPTFSDLVESYKSSSGYRHLSLGSKREYKKPLERLVEMGKGLVLDDYKANGVALSRSRSHVEFWEDAILASKLPNYQKGRLVVFVKMVYRSHGLGRMVDSLKLPVDFRHERGEAHPLTKEKVAEIRAIANPVLRRYALFVALCFHTGMRPSEAMALRWSEVGEEFITIIGSKDRAKGVASRMVPVLPEIRSILDECLKFGGKWVFVSALGRPFNKQIVCEKVRRIYNLVGIKGVLYDTRRGLATEMIKKGYNILDVAGILGHKDTKTTERYIRFSMEEKALNYKGV